MHRTLAFLVVVLIVVSGCATAAPAPGPAASAPVFPVLDTADLVVVASGASTFSVMYEGENVQVARTLDEVLRWIPNAYIWRAVAQVVNWGLNWLTEGQREASTAPHVSDLEPRKVVAGAFARGLMASGRVRQVRVLDGEPVGADRRGADVMLRVSVPTWGLLRVREGKPDLLAGFADVRAQLVVLETGAILWEHEEDVTHPERLPLEAFSRERAFARQAMIDLLERAGGRLASEWLYAQSAGR